jgi:hypothetical protein
MNPPVIITSVDEPHSGRLLEPAYFCLRIVCLVAAFWLAAGQHELGRWNWFALPIGKVSRKKNLSFASLAQYAEIPSLIECARMA